MKTFFVSAPEVHSAKDVCSTTGYASPASTRDEERRFPRLLLASLLLLAGCSVQAGNTSTTRLGEAKVLPQVTKAATPAAHACGDPERACWSATDTVEVEEYGTNDDKPLLSAAVPMAAGQ